jgi:dynein heavy chain
MLERTNDLITYRIDAILDEIATMSLCDLPDDEPITPDKFLQHTQVNKKQRKDSYKYVF